MKKVLTTGLFALAILSASQGAPPPVVSLDPLIDWTNPMSMSLTRAKKFCAANSELRKPGVMRLSESVTSSKNSTSKSLTFPSKSGSVAMQVGRQGSAVRSVWVLENPKGEFVHMSLHLDQKDHDPVDFAVSLSQEISQLAGGPPPVLVKGQRAVTFYNKTTKVNESKPTDVEEYAWERAGWGITLTRNKMSIGLWGSWNLSINGKTMQTSPLFGRTEVAEPERTPGIKADLDRLLDFGTIWAVSPDEFAKLYVEMDAPIQKDAPPQFKWLTPAKESASFTRKLFVYSPATITLFGGAVKVEEAVVEFVKGTAARTTITLYNEEMEPMARPDFQALFKQVGQSLGGLLKVSPQRQMGSGNGRSVAWRWTTLQGTALLEHNDYESQGATGKPEYLRLTLTAPGQAR